MQVCCPNCQSHINCETIQLSGTFFACPNCATAFDLQELVAGVSQVSGTGFLDDRTRTIDVESGELLSGDFVGKFKIQEEVGQGGFGNVYKALDQQLERVVALKIPRQDARSQIDAKEFIREAQMAASVRDSNIVSVHEVGQDGSNLYICSDFIDGYTLKNWVQKEDRTIEQICRIMIRIAKSLDKAHQTELVHRDLKPANILVDKDDNPYLTDFGLARKFIQGQSESSKIEIVGTPAYMSPEQAVGDVDRITRKTDIYALGVILYELVCGRRPFDGEMASVIQDILYQEPKDPSAVRADTPRDLEAIILKAMAKEPDNRYESSLELANDLERFLDGEPTIARPLQGSQHVAYFLRKNHIAISIAFVILFAVGLTYLITRLNAPQDGPEIPKVVVSITTRPARANVAIVPIDPDTRKPLRDQKIQPDKLTPVKVELPKGDYIVEAFLPGLGVQEVRRSVLRKDLDEGKEISFDAIEIHALDKELALVDGGQFEIAYDAESREREPCEVQSFYIQTHEVTCKQFQTAMGGMPRSFDTLNRLEWNANTPVSRFEISEAWEYAEKVGMRLMDYEEYCYVATNRGKTGVPWGEVALSNELKDFWLISDVKSYVVDKTLPGTASRPVFGLFSNVPELTASTIVSEQLTMLGIKGQEDAVAVVGQPISWMGKFRPVPDLPLNTRHFGRKSMNMVISLDYPVGFRCVRSAKPRFLDTSVID